MSRRQLIKQWHASFPPPHLQLTQFFPYENLSRQLIWHTKKVLSPWLNSVFKDRSCSAIGFYQFAWHQELKTALSSSAVLPSHSRQPSPIIQLQASVLTPVIFYLSGLDIFRSAGSALITTATLEQPTTTTNRWLSECTPAELNSSDPF